MLSCRVLMASAEGQYVPLIHLTQPCIVNMLRLNFCHFSVKAQACVPAFRCTNKIKTLAPIINAQLMCRWFSSKPAYKSGVSYKRYARIGGRVGTRLWVCSLALAGCIPMEAKCKKKLVRLAIYAS